MQRSAHRDEWMKEKEIMYVHSGTSVQTISTYHFDDVKMCILTGVKPIGPNDEEVTQVRTVREATEDAEDVHVRQANNCF